MAPHTHHHHTQPGDTGAPGMGGGGSFVRGTRQNLQNKTHTHTQKYNGERASERRGQSGSSSSSSPKRPVGKLHTAAAPAAPLPALPGGEKAAKGGGTAAKGGERPDLFVLPAVKPVLAGIALDHEAGYVVGQPTDAIDGHRRHVSSLQNKAGRPEERSERGWRRLLPRGRFGCCSCRNAGEFAMSRRRGGGEGRKEKKKRGGGRRGGKKKEKKNR